ncbi:hypothetical protein MTR_8g079570 [Medicago truncatula]|uniref:Reverse transcriptase zinc-binding domain-containing protein n=1 Tax=Medicago truncatula TaxID=3880 RepID=G7LGC0_MEDTR|nr:hypothetical protein MTR_8g079570 [Medicago truncatula]
MVAEANGSVGGCRVQESADHLFITCSHFGQLWSLIRGWLGISSVDTFCAIDHYLHFDQLGGFPRQTHTFLKTHLVLMCLDNFERTKQSDIQ